MRFIYVNMQDDCIGMQHNLNRIVSHFDIIMLHVSIIIIKFHVDIIYLHVGDRTMPSYSFFVAKRFYYNVKKIYTNISNLANR